ncbi:LysR family transcriptional regulator [Skermanella mucosa]|uniref:LysR family transcriptional regulator n=1 Tax=Skermanella mucosa TaxID=1789672 RepID=UPI00192AA77B|nr:LysR family transcriptional regulator [Skermanella mucosa]UEM23630.1 LysR family transcriptional regulator [Skermanella mucosa]
MDLLGLLRIFARAAELQGFTAAARDLGLTQPTVSKSVAALEERLGTRLFQRSTQKLSLTEDGRLALEQARNLLDEVAAFEESFGRRRQAPTGLVRLGMPVAFGRLHIVPRLKALVDLHPALEVDLVMGDGVADLVEAGIDVAIRIGDLNEPALIARRIGVTRRVTVASRDYFDLRGRPACPQDLTGHNCIVYTYLATGDEWLFDGPAGRTAVRVRGNVKANNSEAVREAVLAGIGIAVCPVWLFGDEISTGRVETVLPDFAPKSLPIHAVWPSRRFTSPKVRAVVDFLAAGFRADPLLSDAAPRTPHSHSAI